MIHEGVLRAKPVVLVWEALLEKVGGAAIQFLEWGSLSTKCPPWSLQEYQCPDSTTLRLGHSLLFPQIAYNDSLRKFPVISLV